MAQFVIAHMYPDLMDLYGDRGNLICLQKRLTWLGYQCSILPVGLNEPLDYDRVDMLFMGGGSDREQGLVYQDLLQKADWLYRQIQSGFPALFICGAYQLLGQYYESLEGEHIPGLGFYNFYTKGEPERLIGNIVIEVQRGGKISQVVGFENHGGRTYLSDSPIKSWGKVIKGQGNNGKDQTEGMIYNNLIGTYLHGPLLPKNPAVADFFISAMAGRKRIKINNTLDDTFELIAQSQIISKILS